MFSEMVTSSFRQELLKPAVAGLSAGVNLHPAQRVTKQHTGAVPGSLSPVTKGGLNAARGSLTQSSKPPPLQGNWDLLSQLTYQESKLLRQDVTVSPVCLPVSRHHVGQQDAPR